MNLAMTARPTASNSETVVLTKAAIRNRIRALLRERGHSYQDLATALDLSAVSVGRFLSNNQWLSFEHLVETASFLEVPVQELFSTVEAFLESKEGAASIVAKHNYELDDELVASFAKERGVDKARVLAWLDSLTYDERILIKLRYFVKPVATFNELGILFGISRQRIAQFEKRILKKL